jgi:hypothetical protein
MQKSVRKHYSQLNLYVRAANLGWDELDRFNDFPTMSELDPYGKHRKLLGRIERAFQSKLREIKPAAVAPLLSFPNWQTVVRSDWGRLHCYALVRRLFESLPFLSRARTFPTTGTQQIQMTLQISVDEKGVISRVPDPYENFLAELTSAGDLRRLRSCPACRRFFIAWRSDQKACSRRCANLVRVYKFRQKKVEYAANRKFRKRMDLKAVRKGRGRMMLLSESLRSEENSAVPSPTPNPPRNDRSMPPPSSR